MIAAFDPAQQMAAANFSLAMLGVFTIGLPALLITRGNKTEQNRKLLNSTINPWSNVASNQSLELLTVLETPIPSPSDALIETNDDLKKTTILEIQDETESIISEQTNQSTIEAIKEETELMAA